MADLIYPYVSAWTNENPVWEMSFLVMLAALLEPRNFKRDHWVEIHSNNIRKKYPRFLYPNSIWRCFRRLLSMP
jgi:hypothetical protein